MSEPEAEKQEDEKVEPTKEEPKPAEPLEFVDRPSSDVKVGYSASWDGQDI